MRGTIVTIDGKTAILEANTTVYGCDNRICGESLIVFGSRNVVRGSGCTVHGHDNILRGARNRVFGDRNHAVGGNTTMHGVGNTWRGKNVISHGVAGAPVLLMPHAAAPPPIAGGGQHVMRAMCASGVVYDNGPHRITAWPPDSRGHLGSWADVAGTPWHLLCDKNGIVQLLTDGGFAPVQVSTGRVVDVGGTIVLSRRTGTYVISNAGRGFQVIHPQCDSAYCLAANVILGIGSNWEAPQPQNAEGIVFGPLLPASRNDVEAATHFMRKVCADPHPTQAPHSAISASPCCATATSRRHRRRKGRWAGSRSRSRAEAPHSAPS
jgi:hypothetical protein